MFDLYPAIRPFLFRMDAEKAHRCTIRALKSGLVPPVPAIKDQALRVTLWDRHFPNPVGLAAGFDKNAEAVSALFNLGFGFVETGTVTPKPQHGNPAPRIFRNVDHEAVINRMGFPNCGLNEFKQNLQKFLSRKPRPGGLLGINIGMNKSQKEPVKDYTLLVRQLAPFADYLTVNISSPNTPGLRDLQAPETLKPMIDAILKERDKTCKIDPPPLLIKLAPDLDEAQQGELAAVALNSGIDGLILTNTTLARPDELPDSFHYEKGGLSGAPLRDKSTEIIRNFYNLTRGKIPIIGLGGISDGDDAYEKICAGASLVQLYTALVFRGPGIVREINRTLLKRLRKDGYSHISEATGAASGAVPGKKSA